MSDEAKEYESRVNALYESATSIALARDSVTAVGRSRELSIAVTKLDEAAMWISRAIVNASDIWNTSPSEIEL